MDVYVLFSISCSTRREKVDISPSLKCVYRPPFLQPVDHILPSGMLGQFDLLPCSIKMLTKGSVICYFLV